MKKSRVSFSALGGLGEIGLNCYLYNIFDEYQSQYLMVDLGMGFNNTRLSSIETYYPDTTFLDDKKDEICGLFITHGHEDHIGAIPYVWEKLQCPIYATAWTADLILEKCKEHKLDQKIKLVIVQPHQAYKIGDAEITWFPVSHSIPDCNLLLIKTPRGNIVHSGDFKINMANKNILNGLSVLKNMDVDYLFCDSTNILEKGSSGGEDSLKKDLSKLIKEAEGISWISCFSSNMERVNLICAIAKEYNKKVVLFGRSFNTYAKISQKHNILDTSVIIPEDELKNYKRKQLIFLVSGSQGEDRSVLYNILVAQAFRQKLADEDSVIFASRVIPGNEKKVYKLYNLLAEREINFYTEHDYHIHVSGHPKQDELKFMYKTIKPKWIVPMHGETMHLKKHSDFAYENGFATFNCVNGSVVELFEDEPHIIGEHSVGKVAQEGGRMINFNEDFLRMRTKIFYEGTVFITLIFGKNKAYSPIIDILGLLTAKEEDIFIPNLSNKIRDFLNSSIQEKNSTEEELAEEVRNLSRRFFKDMLGKKPLIKVHLVI